MKKTIALIAVTVGAIAAAISVSAHGYRVFCPNNSVCESVCGECGRTLNDGICTNCNANQRYNGNYGRHGGHGMHGGYGCHR